jgi:hypothetical protein
MDTSQLLNAIREFSNSSLSPTTTVEHGNIIVNSNEAPKVLDRHCHIIYTNILCPIDQSIPAVFCTFTFDLARTK